MPLRGVYRGCRSSPATVVEQAPESLPPPHLPAGRPRRAPLQDALAPPLVGSLVMVMRHVFPQQVSDVALPQRHHPVQALLLDRPDEPFGIRVRIRRPHRRLDHAHATRRQHRSYRGAPRGIPVTDQEAARGGHPLVGRHEFACDLLHELPIRVRRRAHDPDAPRRQLDDEQRVVGHHAPDGRVARILGRVPQIQDSAVALLGQFHSLAHARLLRSLQNWPTVVTR